MKTKAAVAWKPGEKLSIEMLWGGRRDRSKIVASINSH